MPRARASAGEAKFATFPSNSIVPASGVSTPLRILMSVDLPAPLSPTSPVISPLAICEATSSSATTAPKSLADPSRPRSSASETPPLSSSHCRALTTVRSASPLGPHQGHARKHDESRRCPVLPRDLGQRGAQIRHPTLEGPNRRRAFGVAVGIRLNNGQRLQPSCCDDIVERRCDPARRPQQDIVVKHRRIPSQQVAQDRGFAGQSAAL